MSNIFVNLELPVNVKIDFGFLPPPWPTKAARRMEEQAHIVDVQRALQKWYYETYA